MQKSEKEILDEVIRIEFFVRKILSGINLGAKNSTFKGHGMTFADIRAYEPGDDIRNFAWQVMARTGQPFVKQFEEERDLEVHVALDLGTSMNFGGLKRSKALTQAYVMAFLGLTTVKSRDKFGGLLFSNQQVKRIPVKRGEDHIRRFLFSYLEEFSKTKEHPVVSETSTALDYFSKIRSKNTLCILVSDFAKPLDRKLLARVKSRHRFKMVHVSDPYEEDFPELGWLPTFSIKNLRSLRWFKFSEDQKRVLRKNHREKKAALEKIAKGFGIEMISQSTHDENLDALFKSLKMRSVYG